MASRSKAKKKVSRKNASSRGKASGSRRPSSRSRIRRPDAPMDPHRQPPLHERSEAFDPASLVGAASVEEVSTEGNGDLPDDRDKLVKLSNDLFVAAQQVANKAKMLAKAEDQKYIASRPKPPPLDKFAALNPGDVAIGLGACARSYGDCLPKDKTEAWQATTNKQWVLERLRAKSLITPQQYDSAILLLNQHNTEKFLEEWPWSKVGPLVEKAIDWTRLPKTPEPPLDDRPETVEAQTLFALEFDLDPEFAPEATQAPGQA